MYHISKEKKKNNQVNLSYLSPVSV